MIRLWRKWVASRFAICFLFFSSPSSKVTIYQNTLSSLMYVHTYIIWYGKKMIPVSLYLIVSIRVDGRPKNLPNWLLSLNWTSKMTQFSIWSVFQAKSISNIKILVKTKQASENYYLNYSWFRRFNITLL